MSDFIAALVQAPGSDAVQTGNAIPPRHHSDWSGSAAVQPLALDPLNLRNPGKVFDP